MTLKERLASDPEYRADYLRKARERGARRYADPETRAHIRKLQNERKARLRGPAPELPTERKCTICGETKPATTEHFSRRKEGRLKLKSQCKICLARSVRDRTAVDEEFRKKRVADAIARHKKRFASDPEYAARFLALKTKRDRRWKEANRELLRERGRQSYHRNIDRVRKYKHRSGPLRAMHTMRRFAAKRRATPAWAHHSKIAEFYERAAQITRETGIPHHVDHVVPIQSKVVCGLHVETNLQILPADKNKRKSNSFTW